MKRLLLGVVLGFALGHGSAWGADDGGVESPLFLGSGGRALGLGRTGVAFTDNAEALFWNSSRLALVEHAGMSLFHTELFVDGAAYNAAFLAYPSMDAGTFALGFQRLGVSGIERRDDRNQILGTFENSESSVMVGYARRFGRTISLGGAARVLQQTVGEVSDASVGIDLGISFERPLGRGDLHRIGWGVNLQNLVAPRLKLGASEVPDPRNVKLGAAYTLAPRMNGLVWMLAADLDVPSRAGARMGAGLEMSYRGLLALRAGIDRSSPTFGAGITWRNLRFDYALVDNATLDRGDRFSVDLRLGRGATERRIARETARETQVADELARRLDAREAEERARARTEADTAFAARRYDDALRLYRRVLALDPSDAAAARAADAAERELALANATRLWENGAMGEAAAALQAVVDRWPDENRAVTALTEARAALQRTADRGRQVNGLLKQALADFSQNDLVAADGALQELLRLDPAHEVARELAQRVRTSRQNLGDQALTRARAAAGKQDYDGALARLTEARKFLGPRTDLARLQSDWTAARGTAVRSEDTASAPPEPRPVRAERRAAPTAEARRQFEQQYREGLLAFGAGDFQRAIRNWRTVWIEAPDYQNVADYLIKAYLYEGIALYSSGKYEQAIDLCNRVLEIDPTNAKAKRYLQRMQEEKSELQQIGGSNGHP